MACCCPCLGGEKYEYSSGLLLGLKEVSVSFIFTLFKSHEGMSDFLVSLFLPTIGEDVYQSAYYFKQEVRHLNYNTLYAVPEHAIPIWECVKVNSPIRKNAAECDPYLDNMEMGFLHHSLELAPSDYVAIIEN